MPKAKFSHHKAMMVMPADNSGPLIHYLAGKYPGRIGWLLGPSHYKKKKIKEWIPYACDNDAYKSFLKKKPWNEPLFFQMLDHLRLQPTKPMWILVPDVVANRVATLENWEKYAPMVSKYGWPLAFAVQDGMLPSDVPLNADVVFVGGSTEWKWRSVSMWCEHFQHVHIGRVNSLHRLRHCQACGVKSVDGTGWMRDTENGYRARMLRLFMEGVPDLQEHFDIPLDSTP